MGNDLKTQETKKNIAILVNSLRGGGAERIAGLLSKFLSEKYNVFLFVTNVSDIVYDYGGEIFDISINGSYYQQYYIKEYKKKFHIDCAISFIEEMNDMNIRTKNEECVIISERCAQSPIKAFDFRKSSGVWESYSYADKIVACAEGVKYDLINNLEINESLITTIYNFIDKDVIWSKAQDALNEDISKFIGNSKLILNVGRLALQKNQKKLIIQFSKLIKEYNNVKLLIIGQGEMYDELQCLIRKLNLEDSVRVLAYNNNPFPYYRLADVFALTSYYEGLPNVLLEAMLMEIPIVASDCLSGPRELLKGTMDYNKQMKGYEICDRGILVQNSAEEDMGVTGYLKEGLKRILCDDNLSKQIKLAEREFMRNYTNEKILDKWIDVIENTEIKNKNIPLISHVNNFTAKKIIIYGAGKVGMRIMEQYLDYKDGYDLLCFAVSDKKENVDNIYDIAVMNIEELVEYRNDAVVLIGVSVKFQYEIITKLKQLGFKNIEYPILKEKDYLFYASLEEKAYEDELAVWYYKHTKKVLDWNNLLTYNEKLQWLKIYDNLQIKTKLSDKLLVREYVNEKIGEQYLIPLLGYWNCFDDIDFEALPDKFVLKCNHGSGWNVLIKNKKEISLSKLKNKFDSWMMLNYAFCSGLELNYKNINPQIIAEKFLETPVECELRDYKVFVFNGVAKIIQVDLDRSTNHRRNLYDTEWNLLPYGIGYPMAPDVIVEKPECLKELIDNSERLGEGFRHVRVDFYIYRNRLYFGEMTFCHGSGTEKFTSEEFALEMGSWIKISEGENS